MGILDLPNELILQIAADIRNINAAYALACANRGLYNLLEPSFMPPKVKKGRYAALFGAVRDNDEQRVRTALKFGADVNKKKRKVLMGSHYSLIPLEQSFTPLQIAAQEGHNSMIQFLLEAGAADMMCGISNPNRTPLFHALRHGHDDLALDIATRTSQEDLQKLIMGTERKLTPLHLACRRGLHKSARFFLEQGANVNARLNDGITPLHDALRSRLTDTTTYRVTDIDSSVKTVKLLIEYGANQDLIGRTLAFNPYTVTYNPATITYHPPTTRFWPAQEGGLNHSCKDIRGLFQPHPEEHLRDVSCDFLGHPQEVMRSLGMWSYHGFEKLRTWRPAMEPKSVIGTGKTQSISVRCR